MRFEEVLLLVCMASIAFMVGCALIAEGLNKMAHSYTRLRLEEMKRRETGG